MPGYTGHVPTKVDRFGATAGQIKKEILADMGKHSALMARLNGFTAKRGRMFSNDGKKANKKEVFGNRSRFANNWIAGPQSNLKMTAGYTGCIPGLISENIHGNSFANCTSKALNKEAPRGINQDAKQRFKSQNQQAFIAKNFRRFGKYSTMFLILLLAADPEMQPRKDYDDYTSFINDAYAEEKGQILTKESTQ